MDNKMVDNDTVNTVVDNLKHTRLLAGVGLATMILGTILPYIKYTTILGTLKISLWESWKGKIVLVLLIANAIFLFKDYIEKYIPSLPNVPVWKKISELKYYQYAMLPSLIATVFVILITMQLDISFGLYNIGFYIFWLGVICVVIYLVINKGKAVMPDKSYVKQDETYDDLKNINNQANNVNQNYNNTTNNNINQNYNNVANNNLNQNYSNGINNNINPNYNNTMNYGINQNNNMNNNTNSGYNNQNANNTMNYTPDNKDINNVANYNQGSNTNINNGINYNQGSNTNINNGINYNQGNNVKNNEMNPNNNQNNNM